MRTASIVAASAGVILLLTGCSATAAPTQPAATESPSAKPSPTPTIDPGPVELTKEEAADRYLGLVCQRNGVNVRVHDAFVAHEESFLNGGAADVTEVKAAGAEAIRVNRLAVELIDDEYYTWPDGIAHHLQTIRQDYMALTSYYDILANATSYETAYYAIAPDTAAGGTAAQEIRYQLGLPADTTASCQGKEAITDTLHAEMVERNEYLASFAEEEAPA